MKSLWTEIQIEQLRTLAGTMPAKDIGSVIGRTKDAVTNKIASMGLPRFEVNFEGKAAAGAMRKTYKGKTTQPKPAPEPKKEPLVARFKNHEAAAKAERKAGAPSTSKLEWCKTCHSPVSNWVEHMERQGHGRTV